MSSHHCRSRSSLSGTSRSSWPFGAWFVHLLDHLKRQNDIADLAGLAVPDQFHLALVLEEHKAKFIRQRLVRLQKTDDLLLFLFSQSWHGNIFLLGVLLMPDRWA